MNVHLRTPHQSPIDEILNKRRIIITCGTGGVGKTTLSAALALRAALLGKRAVVITIDPAKRLATSLGLSSLGDKPTDLTPLLKKLKLMEQWAHHSRTRHNACSSTDSTTGTLAALMPDTKQTLETFIKTLSPSPALTDQVIRNPIFQVFSQEFSGTNEYMAMERLYALDSLRQYDTIILDTPPSRNTLTFLEAPRLLNRFFEEKLIRWLVLPTNKIVASGVRTALGLLEKLTGSGFMTSLVNFASSLFEIRVNFAANLKKIMALLESSDVGFLLVSVSHPETTPETRHFIQSIKDHRFHFEGVALNRTVSYLQIKPSDFQDASPQESAALEILSSLQKREKETIAALNEVLSQNAPRLIFKLPELSRDVHSMEDLFHVAMALDHSVG